jgi:hypothetical protein
MVLLLEPVDLGAERGLPRLDPAVVTIDRPADGQLRRVRRIV